MSQFRVFLGAPSLADLRQSSSSYQWQTVSSESSKSSGSTSVVFPPATLAAASRRISLLYENVIFGEAEEDDEDMYKDSQENSRKHENQTTVFTWPPTEDGPRARANTQSFNLPSVSASRLQTSLLETQETQETASYNCSDASSIGRFPAFSFSLHSISSLSSLRTKGKGTGQKVAVLLATLEVEGPDTIRIKQGKDAGKEVSLLKMILGDEEGNVCKLTAWREIADTWGGNDVAPSVKRGDIVYIENVTFSSDPTSSLSLTASPYLRSKLDICYRTMPYTHEDKRLRPDLRLGVSDVAVRKVGAIVKWFEGMAGLDSA
ncbi:hypothetical protein FIBSPDRAFT_728098 [Athelia psychrophila]|uniref:Shieldin complex subunit 2 first OB fold domain-containing protein n=1 Tax=Athelia psychrophila TaxID=1759441 RepID=A0A166S817_9AGAM|nr:hypothetical protein FIBSPDRAFT_728098 [Fibularhizoctonia sp. CBS 109695]